MAAFDKKQMDAIVNRFLGWKLPETFGPDCYVSFDREKAKANHGWPVGTNLLTADEARAMLEYVLDVTFIPDWSLLEAAQAGLREHMAMARGLRDALAAIAGMDPDGQRADDLGRAARAARDALDALGVDVPVTRQTIHDEIVRQTGQEFYSPSLHGKPDAGVEVLPPGVAPSPEGFGKLDLTGIKRGAVRTAGVQALDEPRCGYCAQVMDFDRQCHSSTDAGRCAMYREFAATHKVDAGMTPSDGPNLLELLERCELWARQVSEQPDVRMGIRHAGAKLANDLQAAISASGVTGLDHQTKR